MAWQTKNPKNANAISKSDIGNRRALNINRGEHGER